MGKGDKKTKKGKITLGSFGVKRKKKAKPAYVPSKSKKPASAKEEAKPVVAKKPAAKPKVAKVKE